MDEPKTRRFTGKGTLYGPDGEFICDVVFADNTPDEIVELLQDREEYRGGGLCTIDTEMYLDSFNQKYPELFEQFRQLASREVLIPDPTPATKMGAQSREPFWSPSWKRKR